MLAVTMVRARRSTVCLTDLLMSLLGERERESRENEGQVWQIACVINVDILKKDTFLGILQIICERSPLEGKVCWLQMPVVAVEVICCVSHDYV